MYGRREEAKLETLRSAAKDRRDAYDRGDYVMLAADAALDQFFDEIAQCTN